MENAAPSRTRLPLNSGKPTRANRALLFLSLAVNLGLVVLIAVVFLTRATDSPANNQAPDTATQRSVESDANHVRNRTRPALPWDQLQSPDLAVYAANLRAVGCPEKTVRDTLLPLIEEKFEAIELPDSQPTNFWASFSQRQAAAAARAEQERTVRRERDKTVKELLGFAWASDELNRVYTGDAAGSIGFLEYERAEKFLCIADRFNRQFEDINNSRRINRRAAIYQAWRAEVGEVLSAEDFEETELRGLLLIFQRHNASVCHAGLSGSELRQLMIARRELCNPLPSALLAGGDEVVQEPDWVGEQQFLSKARTLLGDSRFLDYLTNSDMSIARTLVGLEKLQLPRTTALQIFDLRHDSIARTQQIRDLPIHRAEKRTQLVALRQSAFDQLLNLCNGDADNPIIRANEMWLQEVKAP
ncbi:MAG: hypothetical protein JWO95_2933 [Verrucomicrobiales bacterium]|nr:hypothetical protein [Verrucomicrobiales bacterium]